MSTEVISRMIYKFNGAHFAITTTEKAPKIDLYISSDEDSLNVQESLLDVFPKAKIEFSIAPKSEIFEAGRWPTHGEKLIKLSIPPAATKNELIANLAQTLGQLQAAGQEILYSDSIITDKKLREDNNLKETVSNVLTRINNPDRVSKIIDAVKKTPTHHL